MASKMTNPKKIYGYVAAIKLGQIAAYDCELGDAARRVLSIIIGHANQDGMCFPSISQIAKNYGLSRPAISKQIRILKDKRYLRAEPSYRKNGGRKQNTYFLNLEIAQEYSNFPHILSKPSRAEILIYLVTILRYGGATSSSIRGSNDKELPPPASLRGDIKKPYKETI